MKKLLQSAAVALLTMGVVTPAAAGEIKMTKNGNLVLLECKNDGCYVIGLNADGTRDPVGSLQKLGEGGKKNFDKWRREMRKQGWKKA